MREVEKPQVLSEGETTPQAQQAVPAPLTRGAFTGVSTLIMLSYM